MPDEEGQLAGEEERPLAEKMASSAASVAPLTLASKPFISSVLATATLPACAAKSVKTHEIDEDDLRVVTPPLVDVANQSLLLRSVEDLVGDWPQLLFRVLECSKKGLAALPKDLGDPVFSEHLAIEAYEHDHVQHRDLG
jgi:hypothetical protein